MSTETISPNPLISPSSDNGTDEPNRSEAVGDDTTMEETQKSRGEDTIESSTDAQQNKDSPAQDLDTAPGVSLDSSIPTARSVSMANTTNSATSNARRSSKRIKIRRKSRPTPKIFHDAISVVIPLSVTADLKIAIQHTRSKRIQSIYKRFPALKKAVKRNQQQQQRKEQEEDNGSKGDDPMDDDEDAGSNKEGGKENDGKENNKPSQKKKKKLAHVPQPEQYGSVLDYLEAKYVRGVMLGDEDADGDSVKDGSEGQGSVYSGGSFLDDTDLQRDVAEQVMANTTLTKLELEEDDGEFFVNVGALEVEDNQYGENYDPLQDKDATTTKKRKKPQSSGAATTDTAQSKKKKKSITPKKESDSLAASSKSKKSITSTSTQKKKSTKTPNKQTAAVAEEEGEDSKERAELVAKAKAAKAKADGLFKNVVSQIKKMKDDELPRRKTKLKVALTCPPNKKPGDDITFSNPHNPGQRLRVKVPKDCFPGGTFKVSVPVKQATPEDDKTDHNTFPRDFQESLDDFARAYDDWCVAQSEVDKKFALFKEKQGKFDALVKQFPKNMLTPVTADYLKKVVRRARQNKHKRQKTAALRQETAEAEERAAGGKVAEEKKVEKKTKAEKIEKQERVEKEEEVEDGADVKGKDAAMKEEDESFPELSEPKERIVNIPGMGHNFPSVKWNEADFAV